MMQRTHARLILVCSTLLLVTLLAPTSWAQSAAGVAGISGVVRDPSGATVPNAKVVISSGQGTVREVTSNDAGVFVAPALIPGSGYQVKVTAPGFSAWQTTDIVIVRRPESRSEGRPASHRFHYASSGFRSRAAG